MVNSSFVFSRNETFFDGEVKSQLLQCSINMSKDQKGGVTFHRLRVIHVIIVCVYSIIPLEELGGNTTERLKSKTRRPNSLEQGHEFVCSGFCIVRNIADSGFFHNTGTGNARTALTHTVACSMNF